MKKIYIKYKYTLNMYYLGIVLVLIIIACLYIQSYREGLVNMKIDIDSDMQSTNKGISMKDLIKTTVDYIYYANEKIQKITIRKKRGDKNSQDYNTKKTMIRLNDKDITTLEDLVIKQIVPVLKNLTSKLENGITDMSKDIDYIDFTVAR
jgi:hypothetical protein